VGLNVLSWNAPDFVYSTGRHEFRNLSFTTTDLLRVGTWIAFDISHVTAVVYGLRFSKSPVTKLHDRI